MLLDDLMTLVIRMAINEEFGRRVRDLMDNWRGERLSLRQARTRTGVDIDTLGRMRNGEVTRIDKVIAFARGFEQPVNEWLQVAGYEPIEPERTGSEVLVAGLAALQQELDRPLQIAFKLKPDLAVAEAEQLLATIREQAESGII